MSPPIKIKSPARAGAALLASLPMALLAVTALVVFADLARVAYWRDRAEIVADAVVAATLETRIAGWESVTRRWSETIGPHLGTADLDAVAVPETVWFAVESAARRLKSALSGYKGRVTSVVRVAAEANGFSRETVSVSAEPDRGFGLEPRPLRLADGGRTLVVPAGWYARSWSPDSRQSDPDVRYTGRVGFALSRLADRSGAEWPVEVAVTRAIRWDADRDGDAAVRADGTGGAARDWGEALRNGRFDPYRWPYFRVARRPRP